MPAVWIYSRNWTHDEIRKLESDHSEDVESITSVIILIQKIDDAGYFTRPVLCVDEDTSPDDDFDVNLDEHSFQRVARELRAQRLMKKLY